MSIPKSERKITRDEFFDKALDLYAYTLKMCSKIYGVDRQYIETGLNPDYWIVEKIRNAVSGAMSDLISNLSHANNIFIQSKTDYDLRRTYMNKALGDIDTIKKMCQLSSRVLSYIKPSWFQQFYEQLNKEANLIKAWRQSDNKVLKRLGL